MLPTFPIIQEKRIFRRSVNKLFRSNLCNLENYWLSERRQPRWSKFIFKTLRLKYLRPNWTLKLIKHDFKQFRPTTCLVDLKHVKI